MALAIILLILQNTVTTRHTSLICIFYECIYEKCQTATVYVQMNVDFALKLSSMHSK